MTPRDWVVVKPGERENHVIPRDDDVEHSVYRDCVCGPDVDTIRKPRGVAYVVTHHSLDGREMP